MLTYQKQAAKDTLFSIGLDLDGTSGDFHASFRQVLIEYQGYDPNKMPVKAPAIYSYIDAGCFEDKESFTKALLQATHQGVYYKMKPYEGFRKHMRSLVDNGAEVKVITSRPDDALEDTLAWLDDVAKVPYHSVTITHEKTQIPADVYIDDMPGHIESFREIGRRAIVFDQPYNREVLGERAKTWKQIDELLIPDQT